MDIATKLLLNSLYGLKGGGTTSTRTEILSKIDSLNDIELFIELIQKVEETQILIFGTTDKKRVSIVKNVLDGIIIDLKIEMKRRV